MAESSTKPKRILAAPTDEQIKQLNAAQVIAKTVLCEEVWKLVECIREHPEIITAANPLEQSSTPEHRFFAHVLTHVERIRDVHTTAAGITDMQVSAQIARRRPEIEGMLRKALGKVAHDA